MTITIEVPEDLAARTAAAGIDASEVNHYATTATIVALTAVAERVEREELDPDLVAALTEAAEDLAAGRSYTLEEADARLEADLAQARERIRREKALARGPVLANA